jgi:hypothetical protein
MRSVLAAAVAAMTLGAAPAHAAQVCAWLTESIGEDNLHEVALWMQADADVSVYYMIKGEGLKENEGGRSHSPGSGTFGLQAGKPEKPWGFGATLYPPGVIDIVAEVHATPKDVFSDDEPPLLASFTFHREVPEGEEKAPATLAARQCKTVTFPPRD